MISASWARSSLSQKTAGDPVARALAENEAKIAEELLAAQGSPVDLGGYYMPDEGLAEAAMRPSPTFNAIIDGME